MIKQLARVFLAGAALTFTLSAAQAQTVVIKPACGTTANVHFCGQVRNLPGSDEDVNEILVNTVVLNAPRPGFALVTFNGNVFCNFDPPIGSSIDRTTYRVELQIRPDNRTPESNGPGSAGIGRFADSAGEEDYELNPANITRTLLITRTGRNVFFVRAKLEAVTPNSFGFCNVNGGEMSVGYFPR